jgi:hypothetical protein
MGALADAPDQAVAVGRPVGEKREDGAADVAAAGATTPPTEAPRETRAEARTEPGPETAEAGPEHGGEAAAEPVREIFGALPATGAFIAPAVVAVMVVMVTVACAMVVEPVAGTVLVADVPVLGIGVVVVPDRVEVRPVVRAETPVLHSVVSFHGETRSLSCVQVVCPMWAIAFIVR